MICPQCGHWNRETFPRCFRCGAELTSPQGPGAPKASAPVQAMPDPGLAKVYIQINEAGQATAQMDARDQLAKDMENLLARKQRGERGQQQVAGHAEGDVAGERAQRHDHEVQRGEHADVDVVGHGEAAFGVLRGGQCGLLGHALRSVSVGQPGTRQLGFARHEKTGMRKIDVCMMDVSCVGA